jgi:SAM domain (Sterile alpha motif)
VDVGEWLKSLGLEQYEAAFRENAVDSKLLPRLTADDLKELGVTSLGHRRRLLNAIAALRLKDTVADDPVRLSTSSTETLAERRSAALRREACPQDNLSCEAGQSVVCAALPRCSLCGEVTRFREGARIPPSTAGSAALDKLRLRISNDRRIGSCRLISPLPAIRRQRDCTI